MKITKLITIQWGTLENREWQFTDTVLLTGESGSGKSTLLDSIQTILTAARAGLYQFNAGQDESTQSRRGGKEPRTLAAYALGQLADGVFLRNRSTSYVAAVFDASEGAGELEQPFTAIIGVDAFEEQGKAQSKKTLFFVVRRALSLAHFMQTGGEAGQQRPPLALGEMYPMLQDRLKAGPEVVQRYDDKSSYLQHLYGALMGKSYVPEQDAFRAAKALFKAMAYKELGNVNDLVRDEILDGNDFATDLNKMRELMQTMAQLKADAERLEENIKRLKSVDEAGEKVLTEARRFVVTTIARALRSLADTESEKASQDRIVALQERRNGLLRERLERMREAKRLLDEELDAVKAKLASNDVAQRKVTLESRIAQLRDQFRREWQAIGKSSREFSTVLQRMEQLLALDLEKAPALQTVVALLRPVVERLALAWSKGMAKALLGTVSLENDELPAFELEAFDRDLLALEAGLRGSDEPRTDDTPTLLEAVIAELADVSKLHGQLSDDQRQYTAELKLLQSGVSPSPPDVAAAVQLLELQVPKAKAKILAHLIEPKKGTAWQQAIEGYMNMDRFTVIVEPGFEAECTREVRRRFPVRSPKVAQGKKAMLDAGDFVPASHSITHELVCTHPVARAYLMALYGRVRKVDSEEELAHTPQGLMQEGVGSRAYGMFACRMEDRNLAFGQESRLRRMRWCETELQRIAGELRELSDLKQSLSLVSSWFSSAALQPLAPLMEAVLSTRLQHSEVVTSLKNLDTSSFDALETQKTELQDKLKESNDAYDVEMRQMGENDGVMRDAQKRSDELATRLPELTTDVVNAKTWAARYASAAPELANEPQLVAEADALADSAEISLDALRLRVSGMQGALPSLLRDVNTAVSSYLLGVRTDDERFVYVDPPKSFDRLEEILPVIQQLGRDVSEQVRRQNSIGLAENLHNLADAEARFNAVFTTSFCFKVRDDVRGGAQTLQKLNRTLKAIQFGYDKYELEWVMLPKFQRYADFFEAVHEMVDTLEKDKCSIFDSPRLTPEHHETAKSIKALLLSDDQTQSERSLKELADYRNYRRYDILRINNSGQTRLSTWGTGSGGELETPFYVIRSAVLAHALGHFGRDRKGAPALRLMLSDEAFSKMDESRSKGVLKFLSKELGLQLIVAMPTSKSGALKPEFEKEFTFSKVKATRNGKPLDVSEVQEKFLKQEPLRKLWLAHAQDAREEGRREHLQNNPPADSAVAGDGKLHLVSTPPLEPDLEASGGV